MKIVTFVIPAYNSEQFLDKCISSMLVSELLDKTEIIVVNDGSVDGTCAAANRYVTQYPHVVRLISQENKGHGGALNTGCAAATGKYLKVIDADDWVLTKSLPQYIAQLEQCESDVVLTHYHTVDITTGEIKNWKSFPSKFGNTYTFDVILADWHSFDRNLTFHGITYRTDFYRRFAQPLLEHVFYEDHEFATFPCCHAQTVTPLDLFLYEYRIGDVNQSVSYANQLKRIGHTDAVLEQMARKYQTLSDCPGKQYAARKIQRLLISYLTTALLVNPDKKAGRKLARQQMEKWGSGLAEIPAAVHQKYRFFCLLNRLHISKSAWDSILQSPLYNRLRKNKSFD